MILDERKTQILDFIIRDYITRRAPISSGRIHEGSGICAAPATIRNIMSDLEEVGYLEQPHTSGGRVPTDKAYRYFVDVLMEVAEPKDMRAEIFEEMEREISETTRLFTVMAGFGRKKRLNFCGTKELLNEPEFADRDLLQSFAGMFDNLYEIVDVYRQEMENESVFIGEENPLKEARMMSVIGKKMRNGGEEAVLLIMGPRRMNYERNCSILHYFL